MLRPASEGQPITDFPRIKAQPRQLLSGWKEIANCPGKGVHTVQRYEYSFVLPVRRPAGKARGSVVATKADLDAWVLASPLREAFNLTRRQNEAEYESTATAFKKRLAEMQKTAGPNGCFAIRSKDIRPFAAGTHS